MNWSSPLTNDLTMLAPGAMVRPPRRWTVRAAHAVPLVLLPSGLWRIAMVLEVPGLGDVGAMTAGQKVYIVGLSVVSEAFGLLTLGLVRPWGEVVPDWIPLLGGRRVRRLAAVVPAGVGAITLAALCSYVLLNIYVFHFHFKQMVGNDNPLPTGAGHWYLVACYVPVLAWPPLLALVTIDYHRRHARPSIIRGFRRP